MEQPGLEQAPIWDASVRSRGLTCYATRLTRRSLTLSVFPPFLWLSLLSQENKSEEERRGGRRRKTRRGRRRRRMRRKKRKKKEERWKRRKSRSRKKKN